MRGTLFALSFSILLGLVGCVGELETLDVPGGGGGGGAGGGAGPDAGAGGGGGDGLAFFQTNVQPMMAAARPKGACVACHQGSDVANGPDFLGLTTAENYATLVANTRLVNPTTPTSSVLISRGDHTGDAFCTGLATPYADCTTDEVSVITQWIQMEGQ